MQRYLRGRVAFATLLLHETSFPIGGAIGQCNESVIGPAIEEDPADELPEESAQIVTQPGGLWLRLLCGDALKEPSFAELTQDWRADVDCVAESLLASQIPFCRLHRDMSQQELNPVQFTAGLMAKTGASPTEVVRCERRI